MCKKPVVGLLFNETTDCTNDDPVNMILQTTSHLSTVAIDNLCVQQFVIFHSCAALFPLPRPTLGITKKGHAEFLTSGHMECIGVQVETLRCVHRA